MCGIAGIVTGPRLKGDRSTLSAMLERIRHRGPDADGIWYEENVWLGHKRLSIIDVSETGAQPMVSHCGRYAISFNGEIYNFSELREELERDGEIAWKGTSDTEVLLELIARIGIKPALERINGMFAFAVWDRKKKTLSLARDRFGEKPLYYAEHGGGLVFSSELTAIETHGGIPNDIDMRALQSFLHYGYVPAPSSIYKTVKKLLPGCFVTFSATQCREVENYWSIKDIALNGQASPIHDEEEMVDRLEVVLLKSCKQKMISDVPLGAFLSGGIDSSTVVALMQRQSSRPIKTFTIGFDIDKYCEANHARAVAEHLGTEHTEQILTQQDALDIAPQLGALYDEPFADPSAIATYLLSRMTRSHVTVALSGDGGDELFAGYPRYLATAYMWARLKRIPFRGPLARALYAVPPSTLEALFKPMLVPSSRLLNISIDHIGDKLSRLSQISAGNFPDFYEDIVATGPRTNALMVEVPDGRPDRPYHPELKDETDWMCCVDAMRYLPDDILAKVDRASMAVSLEARVPMLDPQVAELAWRIPASIKLKDGKGKYPLRKLLGRYVPKQLFERPKMGFGIPVREWLAGPLRTWAIDLLNEDTVKRQALLNAKATSTCLKDFLTGRRQELTKLWTLLMLQSWLERRGR